MPSKVKSKESQIKISPPPFHIFMKLGEYFVFDTSACRFYTVDELTYRYLELCNTSSIKKAKDTLLCNNRHSEEEVENVAREISLLSKNGLFDIPDFSINKDFVNKEIDKIYSAPIYGIELGVTENCNLACKYCYCGTCSELSTKGLMSEKVAHQAVMWLFDISGKGKRVNITFFGGEPLLNKPLIRSVVEYSQLLGRLHNKTVTYTMTTNATLLDDEFLVFVKEHNIGIMVSLDGPRSTHDAQCPTKEGKSSYDLVTAGAKRLLTQRHTAVRCTMTHPMPKLKELIDFFEDFGFKSCLIGGAHNPIKNQSSVDFTEEDYADHAKQDEALVPELLEKISKQQHMGYFPFDKIIANIKTCKQPCAIKCGAGHGCLFVAADGVLYPCHRFGGMSKWQIGHISSGIDYGRYKKFWIDYRESLAQSCESCWAWPVCKGPCPWEIINPDGTFEKTLRFCDFRKARIELAAYIFAWQEKNHSAKKQSSICNKENGAVVDIPTAKGAIPKPKN